MSSWQPNLYLEYGKERTQPAIDLVARIDKDDPKRIIDVGCGLGNSTNVLKARWTKAEIIGLDNSETMIAEAKSKYDTIKWLCADASNDLTELGNFDIVFSNAVIQWIANQELLLHKLFRMLSPGGVLAVQVPCVKYMPIDTELKKLIITDKWRDYFENMVSTYSIHTADFYYDILCDFTTELDLWETHYFHVMNTHADIVKWYSGAGLRPYLACLKDDSLEVEFCKEYESALASVYPIQPNGKILFPFTRIFFTLKKI